MKMKNNRIIVLIGIVLILTLFSASAINTSIETGSSNEEFVTSTETWKLVGCDSVYSQQDGTTSNVVNLAYDNDSEVVFSEEWDSSNWLFKAVYLTPESYQHQAQYKELRLDFTQDWSLGPEHLKFYVALCDADGVPGTWGYVWQGDSTIGLVELNIDGYLDSYSGDEARRVAVKVQGTVESGDWGQQNTWRFDFLGFAYKNYIPRLTAHSCDADVNYTLYPHLGSPISQDYAEFSQTVFCRDGYEEIEFIDFRYRDYQSGILSQWRAYWDNGTFGFDYTGDADSSWAELMSGSCSTSTTTYTRTVTFAVRINWGHPTGIGGTGAGVVDYRTYSITDRQFSSTFDYNVETRLDMQPSSTISDSWGPLSHAVDGRTDPSPTIWINDTQPASELVISVDNLEGNTEILSSVLCPFGRNETS